MLNLEKPAWISNWTAALRSGKYTQAQKRLKDGDSYCCLGLLCHLQHEKFNENGAIGSEYEVLPFSIVNRLNIKTQTCHIPSLSGQHGNFVCLSSLNDNGKTFAEIADIIDEHWEQLLEVEQQGQNT